MLIFIDRCSGFVEGRAIDKLSSLKVRQLFGVDCTLRSALTSNAEEFGAEIMQSLYGKYCVTHTQVFLVSKPPFGGFEAILNRHQNIPENIESKYQ